MIYSTSDEQDRNYTPTYIFIVRILLMTYVDPINISSICGGNSHDEEFDIALFGDE